MRKSLVYTLLLVFAALCACKTNEKNMNDAYVKAMAGREDTYGLDSTVYTKIRREMKHGSMTVDGQTVDISTQWINVTQDGGGIRESLKRYNVVVGQFKLEFNAKSMRERLIDQGYPAAFVVQTREPYYYVVVGSFDDVRQAVDLLHKTEQDTALKMKEPLPFILESAQHNR